MEIEDELQRTLCAAERKVTIAKKLNTPHFFISVISTKSLVKKCAKES